ncbi:tRNA (adenosine(37)-N6)-threonylcarbamoyltransferase complex ATPase subunit type 1 TsaE [Halostreptopolyspora alba]|uniref:tRNA threonylcarbamoyladenosine biosynthesis protein TsaE n=1 Tax=Halostreptopolyspora alba TaxID=2487137 RepID=A0A3N0E7L7_9ACTN|nr:tRNA (adenosine(37)-N6)-threonylcarbamoyltransferase complex ATPase subunit type 1 TsaE [Nocardiopsaceae bacterium YIM 96095]
MTDTTALPGGNTALFDADTDACTRAVARRVAGLLHPGDLVILSGPLGAGKTTFVKGIAEGLNVRGPITSPTFVISRIHPSLDAGPALVHVDAYRLGGAAELDDIDLDATLGDSVTVVEWGDGVAEELTDDRLEVTIERRPDDTRGIHMTGVGARWAHVVLDAQ